MGRALVHRTPDAQDGRASLVALTSAGREVLDAVHEHRLAALLDVVVRIPGGAGSLADVLGQLSEAVADRPLGRFAGRVS